MDDGVFFIAAKALNGLHEVVDGANRPICLLGADEIKRQQLPHRALAVILRDSRGKLFLRHENDGSFGFSARGMPDAGMAAGDCFHRLTSVLDLGCGIIPRQLGIYQPSDSTGAAFTWLFSGFLAGRPRVPSFLAPLDKLEIKALMKRGYPFDPFFRLVFDRGELS